MKKKRRSGRRKREERMRRDESKVKIMTNGGRRRGMRRDRSEPQKGGEAVRSRYDLPVRERDSATIGQKRWREIRRGSKGGREGEGEGMGTGACTIT